MIFVLDKEASEVGYRVEFFKTISSTNNLAIEYAKGGDRGLLWIIAEEQTEGRGRNSSFWESNSGNLAASLLLIEKFDSENVASLGFVAGVSFLEACREMVSEALFHDFQLKWPNDLLLKKGKLGGVLLEIIPLANGFSAIVVGIGANVAKIPQKITTTYPITSLHEKGIMRSPSELFRLLSKNWIKNYMLWDYGRGQRKIRKKWLQSATGLGKPISVKRDGNIFSGIFETIDDRCYLVLRQRNGRLTTISAGDVFFGLVSSVQAFG